MQAGKSILSGRGFNITLNRLAQELVENYGKFEDTCIIGIQPRGIYMANRIVSLIRQLEKGAKFDFGILDITFYRDDFRIRTEPISANATKIDFLVGGKNVILIDDVLYTGRTILSAMTALQDFGRPKKVELLTLVDRRFNRHLPIQPDYNGITVDGLQEAYVKVQWQETDDIDQILLYSGNLDK